MELLGGDGGGPERHGRVHVLHLAWGEVVGATQDAVEPGSGVLPASQPDERARELSDCDVGVVEDPVHDRPGAAQSQSDGEEFGLSDVFVAALALGVVE